MRNGAFLLAGLLLAGWCSAWAGDAAPVDVLDLLRQSRKAADDAHVHSSTKLVLYNRIGKSFATAGDKNQARDAFGAAGRTIEADSSIAEYHIGMLVWIALAQAEAGLTDEARKTLRRAATVTRDIRTSSDSQAFYLGEVVEAYAKTGDFDAAMNLAARVPGSLNRAYAFNSIAVAQIQRGDEAGMRAALAKVKSSGHRARALRRIAEAQAAKGDRAGALERASEARRVAAVTWGKWTRSYALLDALHAQVAAGNIHGAEETARAMS